MSKNKLKKKRRSISFLIVSDDQSEPMGFKLSTMTLKILAGVAVFLIVILILGLVFFVKYLEENNANVALQVENAKLTRENNQVQTIAAKLNDLKLLSNKLRISLGIEEASDFIEDLALNALPSNGSSESVSRNVESPNAKNFSVSDFENALRRVSSIKSSYHDMYELLPTLLPVDGLISSGFDDDNVSEPQNRDRHLGIDIVASRGSVIKASGAGSIVFADWTPDLGNLIIVYHGNDIFTYYAHNMRLLRKIGTVKKGEPIALLGSSGETSSGPHLHFEIWRGSKPVDPKEFIFSLQTELNNELDKDKNL